jgi:hypothetical protein
LILFQATTAARQQVTSAALHLVPLTASLVVLFTQVSATIHTWSGLILSRTKSIVILQNTDSFRHCHLLCAHLLATPGVYYLNAMMQPGSLSVSALSDGQGVVDAK